MHTHCRTLSSLYDLHIYYFSAHFTGFLKGKHHSEVKYRALGPWVLDQPLPRCVGCGALGGSFALWFPGQLIKGYDSWFSPALKCYTLEIFTIFKPHNF